MKNRRSRINRHGRFSLPSPTADVRSCHRANPSSQRIRRHQIEHLDATSGRISGRESGIFHPTPIIERRRVREVLHCIPGLIPPSASRLSHASGVPRRPSWIEGDDAVDDEDDDPSSTAYFSLPAPGNRRVHFEEASFAGSHARSRNVRRKNTIAISIMGVLSIVLLVIIGVALTQDYSSHLPHKTSRENSYDAGGNKSRNETSADDIDHVNRTNVIGDE